MTDDERAKLYRRVFNNELGREVLDDMHQSFGTKAMAFIPKASTTEGVCYDPIHAAIRDGQRSVVLHCETFSAEDRRKSKQPEVKK